jgi:hypothetical protein
MGGGGFFFFPNTDSSYVFLLFPLEHATQTGTSTMGDQNTEWLIGQASEKKKTVEKKQGKISQSK